MSFHHSFFWGNLIWQHWVISMNLVWMPSRWIVLDAYLRDQFAPAVISIAKQPSGTVSEWVACHFHRCHKWSPRPECWKTSKFWKTKKFSRQRKINLKCQPKKFQKMKFISFLKDDLGHGTPLDNVKKVNKSMSTRNEEIFWFGLKPPCIHSQRSAAICIEHRGAGR